MYYAIKTFKWLGDDMSINVVLFKLFCSIPPNLQPSQEVGTNNIV